MNTTITTDQDKAPVIAAEAVGKLQRAIGAGYDKAEQIQAIILVAIYEGQLATLASVKSSIK
jgi:hypothetical protein